MKKYLFTLFTFASLACFSQTNTTSDGNWSTGGNWSNGVPAGNETITVTNDMVLDTDLSITGNLTVSGSITDPIGGTAYNISMTGDGILNVNGDISIEGDFAAANRTTVTIQSGDTLFVGGNVDFINNSTLTMDFGSVLIIEGTLSIKNNTTLDINGKIKVTGDLIARNSASLDGSGNIEVGGTVVTNQSSIIFGNTGDCDPGPCEFGSGVGLPIILTDFKGEFINQNTIEVAWVTETEMNNDFFTLFYSIEGSNFIEAKTILGAGNSNKKLTYKTLLNDIQSDEVYLQLKQTDYNGKFKIFVPIVLKRGIELDKKIVEEISLYPNPGSGNTIFASFNNFKPNQYQIHILDNNGKLLVNNSIRIEDGNSQVEVELLKGTKLSKGLHFIRISSDEYVVTRKYIVY